MMLYQSLACNIHEKIQKKSCKNIKFKLSAQTWNDNLNYLNEHILYQIFQIILGIS